MKREIGCSGTCGGPGSQAHGGVILALACAGQKVRNLTLRVGKFFDDWLRE